MLLRHKFAVRGVWLCIGPAGYIRNSGKIKSIYGKWLNEKLKGKVYEEINSQLTGYANKMPDWETAKAILEKNSAPFAEEEFTVEKWKKDFPDNTAVTPLGTFELREDQLNKFLKENRQYLYGAIKSTLKDPEYIIVDKKNGILLIKYFEGKKDKQKNAVIIIEYYKGKEVIVSMHEKGNIKNKFKEGKLLIYSRDQQRPDQRYFPDKQFTRVGDSLNFTANINKQNFKNSSIKQNYGELWGEIIPGKIYSSVLRKITYKITGIEVEVIKNGKIVKKSDDYSNIDNYRIGVIIG